MSTAAPPSRNRLPLGGRLRLVASALVALLMLVATALTLGGLASRTGVNARPHVVLSHRLGADKQGEWLDLFLDGRAVGSVHLTPQHPMAELVVPLDQPGTHQWRVLLNSEWLDENGVPFERQSSAQGQLDLVAGRHYRLRVDEANGPESPRLLAGADRANHHAH